MAKHRKDEPQSFATEPRKNASPNGWTERVEVDKQPDATKAYGWGADGKEGWHDVK